MTERQTLRPGVKKKNSTLIQYKHTHIPCSYDMKNEHDNNKESTCFYESYCFSELGGDWLCCNLTDWNGNRGTTVLSHGVLEILQVSQTASLKTDSNMKEKRREIKYGGRRANISEVISQRPSTKRLHEDSHLKKDETTEAGRLFPLRHFLGSMRCCHQPPLCLCYQKGWWSWSPWLGKPRTGRQPRWPAGRALSTGTCCGALLWADLQGELQTEACRRRRQRSKRRRR